MIAGGKDAIQWRLIGSRRQLQETLHAFDSLRNKEVAEQDSILFYPEAALGVVVVFYGVVYRMGSLTNVGAGYVPVVLGTLLIVMGLLIGITGFTGRHRVADKPSVADVGKIPAAPGEGVIQWRGWGCILAGVAAFVIAGEHLGLVAAIFLSVFISALGDRANSLRDCVLLALGITVAGVLIFSIGLKLTFPLFTFA